MNLQLEEVSTNELTMIDGGGPIGRQIGRTIGGLIHDDLSDLGGSLGDAIGDAFGDDIVGGLSDAWDWFTGLF